MSTAAMKKVRFVLNDEEHTPVPGNLRKDKKQESLVADSGEINASSTKDALQQIQKILAYSASGQIKALNEFGGSQQLTASERKERREQQFATITQALADPKKHKELSQAIAAEVVETDKRIGLLRNLMQTEELDMGELNQIEFKTRTVNVVSAIGPVAFQPQLVRRRFFFPKEFWLKANVKVDETEIMVSSKGDPLDDIFNETLEQFMVAEDKMWKKLVDKYIVGISNPLLVVGNTYNIGNVATLINNITSNNLAVGNLLVANSVWPDFVTDSSFHNALSPIIKHDLILQGKIATIMNATITTDGYRPSHLRVLEDGEMYAVAPPENHGVFTTRGEGILSTPTDGHHQGETTKGFFLRSYISMTVVNTLSVSKAFK